MTTVAIESAHSNFTGEETMPVCVGSYLASTNAELF